MKQKIFTTFKSTLPSAPRHLLLVTAYLLLATLFLLPTAALAQEPDYDRINEIAEQMNCPTCVGINLADCRTQTCSQWRDQIADLVEEGYSDQEVLDYFSTQYGTQVLLEPPKSGSTLFLWVLPVVAILIGGGWLAYTMRRWKKDEPAPAAASPRPDSSGGADVSDDYLSQVEKDLNN